MLNRKPMVNNVEKPVFKKDETPYLVFACIKCRQYSYVKSSQKTKKCLRCGCSHQVKDLLNRGEIVYGMSLAVNTVKKKQNELAVPEFRSHNDFVIETNRNPKIPKSHSSSKTAYGNDLDNEIKFKSLLHNLSKMYRKFPAYMIEILAENSGIPKQELPLLIKEFKNKKFLIQLKEDDLYYKVSQEY